MNQTENCPRCKTILSYSQQSFTYCSNPTCLYVNLNPITYQNEAFYKEQDKQQARFTYVAISQPAQSKRKQMYYNNKLRKGKDIIQTCCNYFKFGNGIQYMAIDKLSSILYLQTHPKINLQLPHKTSKQTKVQNMSLFALQYACFKNENYLHEINLIRYFKTSLQKWRKIIFEYNIMLKQNELDFINIKAEHIIKRVCWKRHINKQQINAMISICDNIRKNIDKQLRDNTLAAISFHLICQESQIYRYKFNICDLCKNHESLFEEGGRSSQILSCFDITYNTVKSILNSYFNQEIIMKIMPVWDSRIKRSQKQRI